jgi:hypothetical protein
MAQTAPTTSKLGLSGRTLLATALVSAATLRKTYHAGGAVHG